MVFIRLSVHVCASILKATTPAFVHTVGIKVHLIQKALLIIIYVRVHRAMPFIVVLKIWSSCADAMLSSKVKEECG